MGRILVTLALAAYNNAANLWGPFNRTLYVPANLVTACLLFLAATSVLGLTPDALGLGSFPVRGLLAGAGVGLALAAPLLVLASFRSGARFVADRRVSGLSGGRLAYQALVRVPLGTALLEELAFRGVVFAAWRPEGYGVATLVSSVAFAVWHVVPAMTMVRANVASPSRGLVARSVAGTVVVTGLAGAALVWLRVETGSLAAPFALHATLNSVATVAGARAGRRLRQ